MLVIVVCKIIVCFEEDKLRRTNLLHLVYLQANSRNGFSRNENKVFNFKVDVKKVVRIISVILW